MPANNLYFCCHVFFFFFFQIPASASCSLLLSILPSSNEPSMNTVSVWQEFNACQFLVSFALLIFSIFYAFREQSFILWPYWLIFLPLFIWKALAITGAIIGILTYCCVRSRNRERNSPIQCRALFLNLIETILLLVFEILVCYNLQQSIDSEHRLKWIVCFLPLIALSIVSVFAYVWLLRHGRSWEVQALFVVNILQFVFFALKLDQNIITWNYVVVFTPLWIVMGVSIIFCSCRAIWTVVNYQRRNVNHLPMAHQQSNRRRCQILAGPAFGHICVLMFLLVFEILLAHYLDQTFDISLTVVCLPLYTALIILIYMSFGNRVPANHWWFGLRQDACEWLLHLCPIFETYANIEYHFNASNSASSSTSMHSVDESSRTAPFSVIQSNRTVTSTPRRHRFPRRFLSRKKRSSFYEQNKSDPSTSITTTMLPVTPNILTLHAPD